MIPISSAVVGKQKPAIREYERVIGHGWRLWRYSAIAFLRFERSDRSVGASCSRCSGCPPRLSTKVLPACKASQRSDIKRRINSLVCLLVSQYIG